MLQPSPQTAVQLLNRTRTHIRIAGAFLYLVFVALYFVQGLVDPDLERSGLFEDVHFWCAIVSVASLLTINVSWIKEHWVQRVMITFFVPVIIAYIAQICVHKNWEELSHVTNWLVLATGAFFVLVGSREGLWANLATYVGILAVLFAYKVDFRVVPYWPASIFTISFVGYVIYSLMVFVEKNVILHESLDQKLENARLDGLTGIYGRAALEERLKKYTSYSQENETPLSIIVTDIDHFKSVNDTHGHIAGDDVLRLFAKRLERNIKSRGGFVGRWGGEEFLIVLPGISHPDALALAEQLRQVIAKRPIAGLSITASFGVASYRGRPDEAALIFGRADENLYAAKDSGRNAVRG